MSISIYGSNQKEEKENIFQNEQQLILPSQYQAFYLVRYTATEF
jgi:hypothetical protein